MGFPRDTAAAQLATTMDTLKSQVQNIIALLSLLACHHTEPTPPALPFTYTQRSLDPKITQAGLHMNLMYMYIK